MKTTEIFYKNNPHPDRIRHRIDVETYDLRLIMFIVFPILFVAIERASLPSSLHTFLLVLDVFAFIVLIIVFMTTNKTKTEQEIYQEEREKFEKEKEKEFKKFYDHGLFDLWMENYSFFKEYGTKDGYFLRQGLMEMFPKKAARLAFLTFFIDSIYDIDRLYRLMKEEFIDEHKDRLLELKEKYFK